MFLTKMKEYEIQSAVLTIFFIESRNLITKEKTKMAYEGKLKNDEDWDWEDYNGSMNDDLESYFENLQLGKKVETEAVGSYFLPKLTKDELKLVEEMNLEHLLSYSQGPDADVDIEEMKKSKSKSKYVHCRIARITKPLKLQEDLSAYLESFQRLCQEILELVKSFPFED